MQKLLPTFLYPVLGDYCLKTQVVAIKTGGQCETETSFLVDQFYTVQFFQNLAQVVDGYTTRVFHLILRLVGPYQVTQLSGRNSVGIAITQNETEYLLDTQGKHIGDITPVPVEHGEVTE